MCAYIYIYIYLHTHAHTPDKALSKDNKLREFSHISVSHKSPSLSTSSERTADIYINITTVKCPMKRYNSSIIAEWDKKEKHSAAASPQQRLQAFYMRC